MPDHDGGVPGHVLLPLTFGVKRTTYRAGDPAADEADQAFRAIRPTVLERDDKRCRYCGFRAERYQEVHHLNGDHGDNRPDNLICACAFCHGANHVGFQGVGRRAVLVALPYPLVSMPQFFDLQRQLFLALEMRVSRDEEHTAADMLGAFDEAGRARCVRLLGHDDPGFLGDFLQELAPEAYATVQQRLVALNVHLLYRPEAFGDQLREWSRTAVRTPSALQHARRHVLAKSGQDAEEGDFMDALTEIENRSLFEALPPAGARA